MDFEETQIHRIVERCLNYFEEQAEGRDNEQEEEKRSQTKLCIRFSYYVFFTM